MKTVIFIILKLTSITIITTTITNIIMIIVNLTLLGRDGSNQGQLAPLTTSLITILTAVLMMMVMMTKMLTMMVMMTKMLTMMVVMMTMMTMGGLEATFDCRSHNFHYFCLSDPHK